ncbi:MULTISPECIES: ABC transporter permease [Nonomuraea]|uniref:Iron ABC transporter permease n=1 Tax=Nonomuraea ferruginea TaxID=46174 RepID=A0ABT4SYH2_9ACTN|nr:iron ABC transporter permease [Nonomuraea ferruginea]MDA0642297.1 iron ABC transporter permease [Nonomuraea ferruginea]
MPVPSTTQQTVVPEERTERAPGSRPDWQRRSRRRLLADRITVGTLVAYVAGLLLLLVLVPTVAMLFEPDGEAWSRLAEPRVATAAKNTVVIGVASTLSATVVGFLFAYALSRPDIRGRAVLRVMALLPLISPPFVVGLAVLLLFGRRGLVTHELLGLDISLLGLGGLWLVQTLAFFPMATLTLLPTLKNIGSTLEWASRDLGWTWFQTFRRVTLPLAFPTILNALLLVGMFVITDFGNPVLIGAGYQVLSVEAYVQAVGRQDFGMAAVLCVLLFVPTLILFLIQRRVLARRSAITVSGKTGSLPPAPLPAAVRRGLLTVLGLVSVLMILIYGSILVGSFTRAWGADWSFTLDHWQTALLRGDDIRNSALFSATAAIITTISTLVAAYVVHRTRVFGRGVLDGLAVLPSAIPGTMIGISWLLTFNEPPIALTGTALILVLVMVVRAIPVGYRTAVTTINQISPSIDEAAADLGASRARVIVQIMFPLLGGAFTTSLVFGFLHAINTLSAVIFLTSPGIGLGAPTIVNLAEFGQWGAATGVAAGLMVVSFAGLAVAKLALGSRLRLYDL